MAVSVLALARQCLQITGPVSARRDILAIRDLPAPRSLRAEARFILRNRCRFGENDVDVLPEYLRDDFRALIPGMRNDLADAIFKLRPGSKVTGPDAALVNRILTDRRKLHGFLTHASFDRALDLLSGIGTFFQERELGNARSQIDELAGLALVPVLVDFDAAFRTTPVDFIELVATPKPGEPDAVTPFPRTLTGYRGHVPTAEQRDQLLAYIAFLSSAGELRFRAGLLRAETHVGARRFAEALTEYRGLLAATGGLSTEQVRFLALRAGFAHLARGDQLYRETRTPDLAAVAGEYDQAVKVLSDHGVSILNPVREQIQAYATAQRAKLDAGFNALGFKDNYVPVLTADFLLAKAAERINKTDSAVARFVDFRRLANQLDDEQAEALLEADVAAVNQEIAAERTDIAGLHSAAMATRVQAISEQLDDLLRDSIISTTGSAIAAFADVSFGERRKEAGAMATGGGLISAAVGYFARRNELENELKIAQIEEKIAAREQAIAGLEESIVNLRRQFFVDRLRVHGHRTLNANLFYALANLYEDVAERNLEAAIRWAYLGERAVAWKRLRPDLSVIQLDYRQQLADFDTPVPLVFGNTGLQEDLTKLSEANVPIGEGQRLRDNPISLRQRYPLEFSRFLQTGQLDFTVSLYDLDTQRPGVCQRRLEKVVVTVSGLVPVTGFTGHIIHRGFFTLRDPESTLTASRLMPLQNELDPAVADLRNGKTQGEPIAGVVPFLLDQDRQELSGAPQPDDTNPDPAALALFEGYGETGHWTLVIDGINLRNIADVFVQFTIIHPEATDALTTKVTDLLRRYEAEQGDALDQTAAFSLRQRFPDAFAGLAAGGGSFVLDDSDFSSNLTDLKVKTIVAQAVDAEGQGVPAVRVQLTRTDPAFELTRTTGAGGFTEALDQEIPVVDPPDRVPLIGAWRVRLPDPTQLALMDDLRLFFIHQFARTPVG